MKIKGKRMLALAIVCVMSTWLPFLQEQEVHADGTAAGGFIIEADLVEGENLTPSIVMQETASSEAKPMLRLQYEKATIYGMRLVKPLSSGNGDVMIHMEAKGPVTIEGMTVDASVVSFEGACLFAGKTLPQVGMKNVSMNAHYMNADYSNLQQLMLQTKKSSGEVERPTHTTLLKNLLGLPLEQLKDEIDNIQNQQLPLNCDPNEYEDDENSPSLDGVTGLLPDGEKDLPDELEKIIDDIENIEDTPLDNVDDIVGDIPEDLEDVIDGSLDDTTELIDETLKDTIGLVDHTVGNVNLLIGTLLNDVLATLNRTEYLLAMLNDYQENQVQNAKETTQNTTKQLEKTLGQTTDTVKEVVKQEKTVQEVVDDTVKQVEDTTKETGKTVNKTVNDTKELVEKTTEEVQSTTDEVEESTEEVVTETEKTIDEVTEVVDETTDRVNETTSNLCTRIADAGDSLSKELKLEIINRAQEKGIMLSEVCSSVDGVQSILEGLEEELLKRLNPLTYIKILLTGYDEEMLLDMENLLKN
ncbi:hypothetical protein [Salinibacillus xinjiangensis]|uniref:Uncharacterized protein n=1 Tax=Salinibacillus xinjiangensis TaxID=1229268 RepID=A0A6G1X5K4_9BACI|nr:hypothetical protein [Salinibacillus xinjiangensis]MRG86283.1 hypothetical protein [Salinibacillus xinjiangensis]